MEEYHGEDRQKSIPHGMDISQAGDGRRECDQRCRWNTPENRPADEVPDIEHARSRFASVGVWYASHCGPAAVNAPEVTTIDLIRAGTALTVINMR
jgi:hypothetical protein